VGQGPLGVTVRLSLDRTDKYNIKTKLNSFKKLIWDDKLFPNSDRIPGDRE